MPRDTLSLPVFAPGEVCPACIKLFQYQGDLRSELQGGDRKSVV